MIIEFYKKIGETPLQAINRFREETPEHSESKISYAGRLDPMAHGTLIFLINESCKLQNQIHRLSKKYRFKILPGVSTNSYDILGIITSLTSIDNVTEETVRNQIEKLKTEDYFQKYPPYSSYRLNGKPLWEWCKLGKINEVYHLVKSKKVDIFNYKIIGMEYILGSDLFNQVSQNINDLGENEYKTFNAKKILDEWELYFKKCKKEYPVFEIEMEVSSGTYIRSICSDIGIMLGIGALAFEIERINVNLET